MHVIVIVIVVVGFTRGNLKIMIYIFLLRLLGLGVNPPTLSPEP